MLPWTEILSLMAYMRTIIMGETVETEPVPSNDEDFTELLMPSSHEEDIQND